MSPSEQMDRVGDPSGSGPEYLDPRSPAVVRVQFAFYDNPVDGEARSLEGQGRDAGMSGGSEACSGFDSDGDATPDCRDACPYDIAKVEPGLCGCNVRETDSDRDRLPDCVETGTGVYLSPQSTGSDPRRADTDGDGISDGDEVLGTRAGLNLPALGAQVLRRDIFIEYDWFEDDVDSSECSHHSHRPSRRILDAVAHAFAEAPLVNADGSTGIDVHQDRGQGGAFSGGNLIEDADGVIADGVLGLDFARLKADNFDPARRGYFHWVLLPHRYGIDSPSSGEAELPGDDLVVALACFYDNTSAVAATIVHELGHNFGLNHGGGDGCNWKPSYPSVMNYKYQFSGVDTTCTPPGDRVITYSAGLRPPLNERSLDERVGMCPGGPAIDWNGNGRIEARVTYDLNRAGDGPGDPIDDEGCASVLDTLTDHDDWAALDFSVLDPARGALISQRVVACENYPGRY